MANFGIYGYIIALQSKAALIQRHPGHSDQKVHGGKRGGGQAAQLRLDLEGATAAAQPAAAKKIAGQLSKGDRQMLGFIANNRGGKGFTFGTPTDLTKNFKPGLFTKTPRARFSQDDINRSKQFKRLADKKLITETPQSGTNSRYNITKLGRQVVAASK